jgi:hypothetical protein
MISAKLILLGNKNIPGTLVQYVDEPRWPFSKI